MASLLVFNRVHRLEIQSVMLVFSTGFVNYCPCMYVMRGEYGVIGGEGALDR